MLIKWAKGTAVRRRHTSSCQISNQGQQPAFRGLVSQRHGKVVRVEPSSRFSTRLNLLLALATDTMIHGGGMYLDLIQNTHTLGRRSLSQQFAQLTRLTCTVCIDTCSKTTLDTRSAEQPKWSNDSDERRPAAAYLFGHFGRYSADY